jgi:hypothetical protein
MSLLALLLAAAPLAASAATPSGPGPGQPPSIEERRARHQELRQRVVQRLRTMRTVELAQDLKLPDEQVLKLSNEMQRFDDRREPLRARLREARWTIVDAARGDAAAAKKLDAAVADGTEARKALATLDLEEYRALAKLVPAEKQPELARFLVQFPQRVQRMIQEARQGMGRGSGGGIGPGGRPMVPGPGPGAMGPGFGHGPCAGEGCPGMGPGPDDGADDDEVEP